METPKFGSHSLDYDSNSMTAPATRHRHKHTPTLVPVCRAQEEEPPAQRPRSIHVCIVQAVTSSGGAHLHSLLSVLGNEPHHLQHTKLPSICFSFFLVILLGVGVWDEGGRAKRGFGKIKNKFVCEGGCPSLPVDRTPELQLAGDFCVCALY